MRAKKAHRREESCVHWEDLKSSQGMETERKEGPQQAGRDTMGRVKTGGQAGKGSQSIS